jgi:phage host-nuclease inhibitor protein Gam
MCEERNILKNEKLVTALTEENMVLRENFAAKVEELKRQIKRLQEDNKVYRSACVSEIAGVGASAAKRPRTDTSDGSGAKP